VSDVEVYLEVWQSPWGAYQIIINELDAEGAGHGYRIAGPKLAGEATLLKRHMLDDRDADHIRSYLNRRFGVED
jgi:hypothetical protein